MRIKTMLAAATLVLFAATSYAEKEKAPETWDGLVEVKSKSFDAAYLSPGADFRPYTKIMIDPTEVAFDKDWMKNMNDRRDISRMVDDEKAQEIIKAARTNFDDIFNEAFTKAGITVVNAPEPNVLRVRTGVVNLYVNAPDVMSPGRSKSYTANAGEATLVIEVRDSMSGALLGRVLDRRETREMVGMQQATSVTNTADFRALFKSWANIAVKGFKRLQEISPIPATLTPGQKVGK
jgi:hypothetical protein